MIDVAHRMAAIDALVARGGRFSPYWGWHDDHRATDQTPSYRPALQQMRGEYEEFLGVLLRELGDGRQRCLQLGMGECRASHAAWRTMFSEVVTLDYGVVAVNDASYPGVDVSHPDAVQVAASCAPFDLLFIDAGHSAEDARRDHMNYGPMVRPGGIVAFHDALRRPGFEDAVQVWRYLEQLRAPVRVIGREVGIAWLRRME